MIREIGIHIEEIRRGESLAELVPAWRRLWKSLPNSTPFQSPDWLIPWWKYFGRGELWSLAFWMEGRLVGFAPLYLDPEGRVIRFLGTGNSDYLDVLARPEHAQAVVRGLLERLADFSARWDMADLQELPPSSALLRTHASQPLVERIDRQSVCPYVDLSGSGRELEAGAVPRSFLKQIRYYARRARREGDVEMVEARSENLDELFETLVHLHAARWSTVEEPGVLSDERSRAFNQDVICRMHSSGNLLMNAMRFDDRYAACFYGFVHGKSAYYYLGGFDPELGTLSPGHQVVLHAMEQASRRGVLRFNFLRGEEEYKYRWGCTNEVTRRKILWPSRPGRAPMVSERRSRREKVGRPLP